jgi:hypothetical protein
MNKQLKIFQLLIVIISLSTFFLSELPWVATTAEPRSWKAGMTITDIELSHSTDEPTIGNEYINKSHEVIITIKNSGETVLTNLNIQYQVLKGLFTEQSGSDNTKTKLLISETYESTFNWNPSFADGTNYKINVSVTAENFGATFGPIYFEKLFIINDVKKDVGPVDYHFEIPVAYGGEYSNDSHIISAVLKNFGNFKLTTSFSVYTEIYSEATGLEIWNDTKICTDQVLANDICEVTFDKPWVPPNIGQYGIKISTSLVGDVYTFNDEFIFPPIIIGNVTDAGVLEVNDFTFGAIYPCEPLIVIAKIGNTGNLNLSSPFSATLFVNSFPDGTNIYAAPPVQIPISGTPNITIPSSNYTAVFSPWGFAEGLSEGKVWINVSIDPTEFNGSSFNNNYSIMIEIKNVTNIDIDIIIPKSGAYYSDDITELVINISNKGTVDLAPYILNITMKNLDTGEVFNNYSGKINAIGIQMNDYKLHYFSNFIFTYDALFEVNASTFEIKGGEVNGTLSGTVIDTGTLQGLPDIIVNIYLPLLPDPILVNSTTTNVFGEFSFEVPAVPAGRVYLVEISEKDNYWWHESSKNIKIYSGRESLTEFSLTSRATGKIGGKVALMSAPGAPEVIPDWSGITVSVEDSPVIVSTDSKGNFEADVVADSINITATKTNFKDDRLEYITVIPSQTTTVELTLEEAWAVDLTPKHLEEDVDTGTGIVANFDSELDQSSVRVNTLGIFDMQGRQIQDITKANYEFIKDGKSCRISPPKQLEYNTTYQVVITLGVEYIDSTPALHRVWKSTFTTELGSGTLEGFCSLYWSRMPLEAVKINLSDDPDYTTETDNNGFFFMENVPAGEYQFNVLHTGYPVVSETIVIDPGRILWKNVTFNDGLPVPRLWGTNLLGKKILITDNSTERIKVDTEFSLTSNIPLNPDTVNDGTIKIIDKSSSSGTKINYKNIVWTQNRLSFILQPANKLKFNSSYEVLYGSDLRTFDGREIFWKDYSYSNFTTDLYEFRPLSSPNVNPSNNAVNIPINYPVTIDFPVPMNMTSVESRINATFNISGFEWYAANTSVKLLHNRFDYFTEYTITLEAGMLSDNAYYKLMTRMDVSFTTITGLTKQTIGPIKDTKGKPIAGVGLNIYDSSGNFIKSSLTDSSGYAIFYFETALEPGNYTITMIKPNYEVMESDFSVNESGGLSFTDALPQMKKLEAEEEPDWLIIGGVILIVILVVIFIFSFFIFFRMKGAAAAMAKKKDGKDEAKDKIKVTDEVGEFSIITKDKSKVSAGAKPELAKPPKVSAKQKDSGISTGMDSEKPKSSNDLIKKIKGENNLDPESLEE